MIIINTREQNLLKGMSNSQKEDIWLEKEKREKFLRKVALDMCQ